MSKTQSRRTDGESNNDARARFLESGHRDRSDLLARFLAILDDHQVRFCVIGGQGVNAYAEPVVSLDLAIVVAISDLPLLEPILSEEFPVERFAHTLPFR